MRSIRDRGRRSPTRRGWARRAVPDRDRVARRPRTASTARRPSGRRAGRQEQAGRARRRDEVQRIPEVPEQRPEGRRNTTCTPPWAPSRSLHLDAEQPAHRAVRAVGADEVAGPHGRGAGRGRSRSVTRTRRARCRRPTSSVPSSNRVPGRDPTWRRSTASSQSCGTRPGRARADHRGLLAARVARPRGRVPSAARASVGHSQSHTSASTPPARTSLLEAPGPQQLHRAGADHRRPGQRRRLGPLLDEQRRDPVVRRARRPPPAPRRRAPTITTSTRLDVGRPSGIPASVRRSLPSNRM